MNIYQFTETRWAGSPPIVCIGPAELVESVFTRDEIKKTFGGYIVYADSRSQAQYLGVWGARNASRFRRILSERGATFRVRPGSPPNLQMTFLDRIYPRPHAGRPIQHPDA